MGEGKCLIWETPAEILKDESHQKTIYSYRAGGEYCFDVAAYHKFKNSNICQEDNYKIRLTTWLVEQRRFGIECPKISETQLNDVKNIRRLSVQDRADALLNYLQSKSDLLGAVISFKRHNSETQYELLAWTASIDLSELVTLSEYCQAERWIDYNRISLIEELHELMLRPPGYARLEELDRTNINSKQAFVAMWFDSSMGEAYKQGIEPAIEDAGYEAVRIDRKDHNNKIDDQIIAEIRRSRFLVADFTQGEEGARGGVYYEAGFAHGLNIPVIFTCKKGAIDKVHFDTRQYNHIVWESYEELRTRLSQRISATIGDGPNKIR